MDAQIVGRQDFWINDTNYFVLKRGVSLLESTNRKSHCPPMEITNSLDNEKSESQHSTQPLDQVNYGTPPDEMVRSFEDYNWELGRMIRYRRNDKGGTDRL